ncbi:pyrroloquinoline quinone biosynthesis protein D [Micromonospora pisi]|uniref:Pyrroloquinoline quinone biosynthesis protein D n=1 Tax=Micromonospora pisi TaxID=589240 RepID=A0A495JQG9_9ACTN|nr:PqqD family protein [Micromonospora pisi]RKR91081.1 pyrroloquinoline quinone biosynthesis protein D [Micromonospora pisi]
MTPDTVPSLKLDTRWRSFRGKVFIARGDQAFELSEVAAFVYKRIDGNRSIRQIGEELAGEYDIPVDEAVSDIVELLTDLASAGVIDVKSA